MANKEELVEDLQRMRDMLEELITAASITVETDVGPSHQLIMKHNRLTHELRAKWVRDNFMGLAIFTFEHMFGIIFNVMNTKQSNEEKRMTLTTIAHQYGAYLTTYGLGL